MIRRRLQYGIRVALSGAPLALTVFLSLQPLATPVAADPLLARCFETPGVRPSQGNRPGYTYESFTRLFSSCGACEEACRGDPDCLSWTCFHPSGFGAEGVRQRPIACHLKSEFPLLSPSPCDPPSPVPTSGNGVRDDRCYHSSQAPLTLPDRPERRGGVATTVAIADPNIAASLAGELNAEQDLLDEVEDYFSGPGLKEAFSILPECGGALRVPAPGTAAAGPGLVAGPEARDAFEALRRDGIVGFTDLENHSTGVRSTLTLRVAGRDISATLRTTEYRYPLPPTSAPANTPVVVLPYSFVSAPPNHRLMGVAYGDTPDGQSKYELIFSAPVAQVGLLRMWNTNSVTRFYGSDGSLLAEHRNRQNQEFVGFVSDRSENLVHRIEFDGIPSDPASPSNKAYQVGEVDDLYIGIEPLR